MLRETVDLYCLFMANNLISDQITERGWWRRLYWTWAVLPIFTSTWI